MKNGERMLWVAILVLTVSVAFWVHMRPDRPGGGEDPTDRVETTSIQARCGVAAGKALASREVTITCGLDETGIEAVIARSISDLNIDELAAQARQGPEALSHDADEMALRLGLTREALIQLLAELSAPESAETITPELLAVAMTRGGHSLPIVVLATVSKSEREPDTRADTASPHTSAPAVAARQEPDELPRRERAILAESARLQVECGIVAGANVSVGSASIRCGRCTRTGRGRAEKAY